MRPRFRTLAAGIANSAMEPAEEIADLRRLLSKMRERVTGGHDQARPIVMVLEQMIAEREQQLVNEAD